LQLYCIQTNACVSSKGFPSQAGEEAFGKLGKIFIAKSRKEKTKTAWTGQLKGK